MSGRLVFAFAVCALVPSLAHGQSCPQDPGSCYFSKIAQAKADFGACIFSGTDPIECFVQRALATIEARQQCFPCPSAYSCVQGQCTCDQQSCPSGTGQVWVQSSCSCECPQGTSICPTSGGACVQIPSCTGGQVFNPATCTCECAAGAVSCGGLCVTCASNQTVGANCQCLCTNTCPPGETLDPNTCACSCGGTSCSKSCCNATCVDGNTDPNNCGGCGVVCANGTTCQNGACDCPGIKPNICNGICTNFKYDPGSCGGCGPIYVCPSGLPNCCPSSSIGSCTSVLIDGLNCGACGHACSSTTHCEAGACVPNIDLTGTWSGPSSDQNGSGFITWVLTQNDPTTVTGSVTVVSYPAGSPPLTATGAVVGNLSAGTIAFLVTIPQQPSVPCMGTTQSGTATTSTTEISGSYTTYPCGNGTHAVSGTFDLRKQ